MNARLLDERIQGIYGGQLVALAAAADPAGERTVRYIASDETVDRYGDVIAAKGWQLENFRRNPVLLYLHDQAAPIGRVSNVEVKGKRLMADAEFAPEGVSQTADDVYALVKAGILRAVSVGFTNGWDDTEVIRGEDDQVTGIKYLKPELLELSVVSVPANPNALQVSKGLGLSDRFIESALVADASVREAHAQYRRRLAIARLTGVRFYSPRRAVPTTTNHG